jgi:ABC-type nitrate/sulfonate/bicarbonate transport system substrate-binding protein
MPDLRTLKLISFGRNTAITAATIHGLFEREGLAVETTETPNSTFQMRGLGKGEFDLASTAFDNVLAWSGREGTEFVAVAHAAESIILPMCVRPEIKSWEDLRGRPLAVDAVDTAYALVLRRMLREHGLEMERADYTLVPAGATGYRFESMEKGETFAAILNPPWNRRAAEAGMPGFGDHRDVLPDYPGGTFAVSPTWAAENRDALLGFLRALAGALKWVHHPETQELAAARIAAENGTTPEEAITAFARLPKELALNVDGLQVVLDLRVQFDLTPPMGPDIASYYDTSYAEAALAS